MVGNLLACSARRLSWACQGTLARLSTSRFSMEYQAMNPTFLSLNNDVVWTFLLVYPGILAAGLVFLVLYAICIGLQKAFGPPVSRLVSAVRRFFSAVKRVLANLPASRKLQAFEAPFWFVLAIGRFVARPFVTLFGLFTQEEKSAATVRLNTNVRPDSNETRLR